MKITNRQLDLLLIFVGSFTAGTSAGYLALRGYSTTTFVVLVVGLLTWATGMLSPHVK